MGVTSLGLALHDEAAAFHDVLTNIPSDGEEMLEEGEIEPTTEESDIEIILEPMDDPDLSHRRSALNHLQITCLHHAYLARCVPYKRNAATPSCTRDVASGNLQTSS